jgi:hypothetical protein
MDDSLPVDGEPGMTGAVKSIPAQRRALGRFSLQKFNLAEYAFYMSVRPPFSTHQTTDGSRDDYRL